jgi:DNA mismatch endonuclease (patch repair protein)
MEMPRKPFNTTPARSALMSRIRSTNTTPELLVRSLLHRMGYRFRLHVQNLPGRPDIVLPKYRTVIFVHGCFWHQHPGCSNAREPKTNVEYWLPKLATNVNKFNQHVGVLNKMGWNVAVIWECEAHKIESLKEQIVKILTS